MPAERISETIFVILRLQIVKYDRLAFKEACRIRISIITKPRKNFQCRQ